MLELEDKWIWDSWYAEDQGLWHAFFLQADKRALIKSETHDEITAGDYILGRIRSNFAEGAGK